MIVYFAHDRISNFLCSQRTKYTFLILNYPERLTVYELKDVNQASLVDELSQLVLLGGNHKLSKQELLLLGETLEGAVVLQTLKELHEAGVHQHQQRDQQQQLHRAGLWQTRERLVCTDSTTLSSAENAGTTI